MMLDEEKRKTVFGALKRLKPMMLWSLGDCIYYSTGAQEISLTDDEVIGTVRCCISEYRELAEYGQSVLDDIFREHIVNFFGAKMKIEDSGMPKGGILFISGWPVGDHGKTLEGSEFLAWAKTHVVKITSLGQW
jgi:hypothetical protein